MSTERKRIEGSACLGVQKVVLNPKPLGIRLVGDHESFAFTIAVLTFNVKDFKLHI